jgi:hypothetical protein
MLSNDLREEISTGSGGSGAPRGAASPRPATRTTRWSDDKAGVVTALKTTHGTANEGSIRYEKHSDTFVCPAGQRLHHFHQRRGHWEYRAKRGVCAACPLRSQCTRDKSGRTLKRYEYQEALDKARQQSHSEAARQDRRRRQWFKERHFAEVAVLHGFKRARWRGWWCQSIQDLLMATPHNLKILVRKTHSRLDRFSKSLSDSRRRGSLIGGVSK